MQRIPIVLPQPIQLSNNEVIKDNIALASDISTIQKYFNMRNNQKDFPKLIKIDVSQEKIVSVNT